MQLFLILLFLALFGGLMFFWRGHEKVTSVIVDHPVATCPNCVAPSVANQPKPVVPAVEVPVTPAPVPYKPTTTPPPYHPVQPGPPYPPKFGLPK